MERVDFLAQLAEIVGAIAVVVSVVYLAVQVAGNTRALKSQGHYNALSLAQRPLELMIPDQDLSDVVIRGYKAPDTLSESEWQRFVLYQVMAFNAWEYLYYANVSSSIPVNLWKGADAYYRDLIARQPGLVRFWSQAHNIFDEPFHSYADALVRASHAV